MAKLNEKGWKKFNEWNAIYEKELERLRIELNDPDYFEGWCIIDDYDHVKTIEDEVGLLVFGYDENIDWYFDEWRDIYKDDEAFFTDINGKDYTLKEVEDAIRPYYSEED